MIKKDMKIAKVLEKHPDLAKVFFENGLFCVGCHLSHEETIEQGASAHGIDVDKLIKKLNGALKESK